MADLKDIDSILYTEKELTNLDFVSSILDLINKRFSLNTECKIDDTKDKKFILIKL